MAGKFPRLRSHTRRGKAGQVWTNYYYDMRGLGADGGSAPDVPLGRDYDEALRRWKQIATGVTADTGLVREAIARFVADVLPTYTVPKTHADYGRACKNLAAWCGGMRWERVTLPLLRQYLERRSAGTQANRELSVLQLVWGKARVWGMTTLPWPAQGLRGWKNRERAREGHLDEATFAAIYAHADRLLRDAMDLCSTIGCRLTDALAFELPADSRLRLKASSKVGKAGWYDADESPALGALLVRRRALDVDSPALLVDDAGRPATLDKLDQRWRAARAAAQAQATAAGDDAAAEEIGRAWLRDHRKLAAELAGSTDAAQKLLQHSSSATTRKHYRKAADKLPTAR